jgi:hypothetical protein
MVGAPNKRRKTTSMTVSKTRKTMTQLKILPVHSLMESQNFASFWKNIGTSMIPNLICVHPEEAPDGHTPER